MGIVGRSGETSPPLERFWAFSGLRFGFTPIGVGKAKPIQGKHSTVGQVPWNCVHQKPFPSFRCTLAHFAASQVIEKRGVAIFVPGQNCPGGFCRVEFRQDNFVPSVPVPYRSDWEQNWERFNGRAECQHLNCSLRLSQRRFFSCRQ